MHTETDATVVRFPRPMKRGRKVTKGPKATVVSLYESPEPTATPDAQQRCPQSRIDRMADLIVQRHQRIAAEKAALRANPKIIMFSDHGSYREREIPADADPEIERVAAEVRAAVDAKLRSIQSTPDSESEA